MNVVPSPIPGVLIVESAPSADERGSFCRLYTEALFHARGLPPLTVTALADNPRAWTLRGLHFQKTPHAEAKLVSCVTGRIFDVALDLRRDSPTFGRSFCQELESGSGRALYVPEGCAHGYLTLLPDTRVLYHLTDRYAPEASGGVRWNDPRFEITWPGTPHVISERDRCWPDFTEG